MDGLECLAAEQKGLVTRAQALHFGMTKAQLPRRLERIGRGIYRVPGEPPSTHQRWLAACCELGEGAVLSHRGAARLHHLDGVDEDFVELTVSRDRARRPRRGILLHHSRNLAPRDVCSHDGIPVTALPRTLVDLAGCLPEEPLAFAFESAWRCGSPDLPDQVAACLRRVGRGRPGAMPLRRWLRDARSRGKPLRSAFEVALWRLFLRSDLPRPKPGWELRDLSGRRLEIDFAYPARKLAIEAQGVEFHWNRFEEDSHRMQRLGALGWTVIPVTWHQVQREPTGLVRRLCAILGRHEGRRRWSNHRRPKPSTATNKSP